MTEAVRDADASFVEAAYKTLEARIGRARTHIGRPLTWTEKLLLGHLDDAAGPEGISGDGYLYLKPDRVALHDVTGQTALLQFMLAGRSRCAVPATVHCDHLIVADRGADADTREASVKNGEVFEFLRSAAALYGLGFWNPGAGIIHQVIFERYAFPGLMIVGTDSHTPNAGGLGCFAAGVGGADAVDVMAGMPWELVRPKLIGIRLAGSLRGWAAPKDVILKLAGLLTVSGGTNAVLEYFGPGTETISATGKATICNMGAELGATASVFPCDRRMTAYLEAAGRREAAMLADHYAHLLGADDGVAADPERYFDRVIDIDLDSLEPHLVGPVSPDVARPISDVAATVDREGYPDTLSAALIGSCTNSSYEDLSRAADVARQAAAHGVTVATELLVTPGSETIEGTIRRDGQMASLQAAGARVMANACGPCIGRWRRDLSEGEVNSIVTTFNRNFPARNDGNAATLAFVASPETVMALSLAGTLSFNPLTDTLTGADGETFRLEPPGPAPEVPPTGFAVCASGYEAPPKDGSDIAVVVDPTSERLQLLSPFPAWDGRDFDRLHLLVKAKGKCTTDHISPAGRWLAYRGHLERLSENAFLGVCNAFSGDIGSGLDPATGERAPLPAIARAYRERDESWLVIGDWNYGEGSSREHAAMSPRLLGCKAVIARSFARIHESNLKRQGLLALTFADPDQYDRIRETDRISVTGLADLEPGRPVDAVAHHADGSEDTLVLGHTMSAEHIAWFRAGSALNALRA